MTKHIVKCRFCKQEFDAKESTEDIDWVMPSRNYYYHQNCYVKFKTEKNRATDKDWIPMIYDLIARDLKKGYNWHQIEAQRKKFIQDGMTNKGIYFTMYWHFLIQKKPWKEEYGIGLIPHIYEEGTNYWVLQEQNSRGIIDQIEELKKSRFNTQVVNSDNRNNRRQSHRPELPE